MLGDSGVKEHLETRSETAEKYYSGHASVHFTVCWQGVSGWQNSALLWSSISSKEDPRDRTKPDPTDSGVPWPWHLGFK